ncbi:MAG: pilus assembly protein [Parasporobacterium sp.]|nr:pilus assembly protein [Parasporobacterium sp.]
MEMEKDNHGYIKAGVLPFTDCSGKKDAKAAFTEGRSIKQEHSASFTLEAAMLILFLFGSIYIIIYGAIYLHDRTVLQGAASQAALRGRVSMVECEDCFLGTINMEQWRNRTLLWRLFGNRDGMEIELYAQSLAAGKLAACEGLSFAAAVTPKSCIVQYEARTKLPWPFWAGADLVRTISGRAESRVHEPEEIVRLVRAIMDEKKSE